MSKLIEQVKKSQFAKPLLALLAFIGAGVLLMVHQSSAQLAPASILSPSYLVQSGVAGWTNALQGSLAASNTVTPGNGVQVIDLSKAPNGVQLQFLGQSSGSDTATKGIVLARNVDAGTNWEVFLRWNVTGNGANYVAACTNLSDYSLGGMPCKLTVLYITNDVAAGTYLSNYSIKYNIR
jgi:hypothetical protein